MLAEHYETVGFGLFVLAFITPSLPAAFFLRQWLRARANPASSSATGKALLLCAILGALAYTAIFSWGSLVEPDWPELNCETATGPFSPPLRLLHLSDLHLQQESPAREKWMLRQVAALKPDLIVITGDIHQMENFDVPSLAKVLSQIHAPLGVFGCVGFDNVRILREAAPHLRMLENEMVTLRHEGKTIALAGLNKAGSRERIYEAMKGADYRIVLHHTPDLAAEAANHGADLYLCGHTHGGQVRLPLWGAIITLAETGKRFEAGRYQIGGTTIYTSRGLGLEPKPAPQVRFLCRPEICLFTIGD
jgi:predicted MPP superfamily phosphohydrolase